MQPCPHCGAPAHFDGACPQLEVVQRAFAFPSAYRSRAGGRVLWIRATRMSSLGVGLTAALIAATLGAWLAADSAFGLVLTTFFGLASGVALVLLSDSSHALRVIPGMLERYAGAGVSGQPTRHPRAELRAIQVRATPIGIELVAQREGEEPLVVLSGIPSRPVAERLAAEISRVLALEPFTGSRLLPLPASEASGALALKWQGPSPIEVRVDEAALHVKSLRTGELRFDADSVEAVDVEEEVHYVDATPVHHLVLKLRKGQPQRVLSGPPGPVAQLAQHARALWKLR